MSLPSSEQAVTAHTGSSGGSQTRVLLIDNYDSFTYNLVQLLESLGARVHVVKNDTSEVTWDADAILLSAGPCGPKDAGLSLNAVSTGLPCLGICLGHQVLAYHFGGATVRAVRLLHGKSCAITHDGSELFVGTPQGFLAARYNSLTVREPLPASLCVTARDEVGEVMALKHRERPIYGVQFHPESILSTHGRQLIRNWLRTL